MKSLLLKFTTVMAFSVAVNVQAEVEDKIEREFDVDNNASFHLNNINGSVDIKSWNKSIILVSAHITADDQDDLDNIIIDMQQSGLGVHVETEYKKKTSWGNNSQSGKVEYTVTLPKNLSSSALELVNGSLKLNGVHGDIKAELVNGSIKAKDVNGNGEFSSVNGSIHVVYNELPSNVDRIVTETVNGSIKLIVPKSLSAEVEAETMHGSIKTDFGLRAEKNFLGGRSLDEAIGSGDIKITMESVNGSLKLLTD